MLMCAFLCLLRNLCEIVTDSESLNMFPEEGNNFLASLLSFRPNKMLTLWPGFGGASGYYYDKLKKKLLVEVRQKL